jgi:selenide,water dikinase
MYGRIAAVNALSDIYAMGGKPLFALNVLCFPTCDFPLTVAHRIMEGGAAALEEAGCALAGGHSIQGKETVYGMAVTGCVHPDRIFTNKAAKQGDAIVLTKAIGTGVLLLAQKAGILSEAAASTLFASLTMLNSKAVNIASKYQISAATDVSGFGLVGHLHEMAKASQLKALLQAQNVPLLPHGIELAAQGLVPAAAYANRKSYESISVIHDNVELALSDLIFDPQTSGGLLLSVKESDAESLIHDLTKSGLAAANIGSFQKGESGQVEVSN